MYLAPAPVETGQKTPAQAYNVLLSMRKKDEKNDMYYCFWGILDFVTTTRALYDSMKDCEKENWVKRGENEYVKRETNFTVVPGYEEVTFTEARDKSLYHPGRSIGPLKDVSIEDDPGSSGDDGAVNPMQKKRKERRVPQQEVVGDGKQTECILSNERSFILYCTTEPFDYVFQYQDSNGFRSRTEKNYLFQILDVPKDSYIGWTYTNRMGVFKAKYKQYGANNYKLSLIEGGTRGTVWGMGENTWFLRTGVLNKEKVWV